MLQKLKSFVAEISLICDVLKKVDGDLQQYMQRVDERLRSLDKDYDGKYVTLKDYDLCVLVSIFNSKVPCA